MCVRLNDAVRYCSHHFDGRMTLHVACRMVCKIYGGEYASRLPASNHRRVLNPIRQHIDDFVSRAERMAGSIYRVRTSSQYRHSRYLYFRNLVLRAALFLCFVFSSSAYSPPLFRLAAIGNPAIKSLMALLLRYRLMRSSNSGVSGSFLALYSAQKLIDFSYHIVNILFIF